MSAHPKERKKAPKSFTDISSRNILRTDWNKAPPSGSSMWESRPLWTINPPHPPSKEVETGPFDFIWICVRGHHGKSQSQRWRGRCARWKQQGSREHRWQCTKRAFTQRFLHASFLKRRMIIMVGWDRNNPWLGSRGEMKKESRETGKG